MVRVPKKDLWKAIRDKCRDCIYDPKDKGSFRQQVTRCLSPQCPLYPYRPQTPAAPIPIRPQHENE